MDSLRVMELVVNNYKNLGIVELNDLGNRVILEGKNGVGKTHILQALQVALESKAGLPEGKLSEFIKDGKESATINLSVGDGQKISFTVRIRITENDFDIQVREVLPDGRKKDPGSPVAYLKKIIGAITFNPQTWRKKGDAQLLEEFFDFFPELRDKLTKNSLEIINIERSRARALEDLRILRVDLDRTPFIESLPEKEVDPASLFLELKEIQDHNQKKDLLKNKMVSLASDLKTNEIEIDSRKSELKRKVEMLREIQKSIDTIGEEIKSFETKKTALCDSIQDVKARIDTFEDKPTTTIEERINSVKEDNEKIRENIRHKHLNIAIEQKAKEVNEWWEKIKVQRENRKNIMQSVNMPIAGLQIGDGCLQYPNKNMDLVRLSQLSSGEALPVICAIHAAFNPKLLIMIIDDLNDLDEDNEKELFDLSEKYKMQLWAHRTVKSEDQAGMGFLIKDGEIVKK